MKPIRVIAGMLLCALLHAQASQNTPIYQTALSQGMGASDVLLSITGNVYNAPSAQNPLMFLVDAEAMQVIGTQQGPTTPTQPIGTIQYSVKRAQLGTTAVAHNSAAVIWSGFPSQFGITDKSGSCNPPPQSPQFINVAGQKLWSCVAGTWTSISTAVINGAPLPLPVIDGGTGTSTPPGVVGGNGIGVSGAFPNQTVALNTPVSVANGGTGTATPSLIAGNDIVITGSWPDQTISATQRIIYSDDYAFTTPNFAQALTAGTPATVTLAISPIGVNGTDTFHPIYIPGSNAEAVIITGGTCTSAALNCTLTFTPASNHASGWHFQSADAGINEALQICATAGGGITETPAGTITLHGIMDHKSGCSQFGQGMDTTILQVAAGEFGAVQGWHAPEYGYAVDRSANGSGVTRSGYTIDMQGSTQSSVPTNTGTVVEWFNQNESLATQVGVIHSPNPANFLPFLMFGTSANNTIQFSKVIDDPLTSCTNTGAGGYFIQTSGAGNKVLSSYGEAGCQAMFQAGTSAAAGTYAYDTYNIGATTMAAGGQQFDVDSSGPGWQFIGNKCFGNGSAPTCFAAISDDPTIETIGTSFTDNEAINPGFCYQIAGQGNTKFTRDTEIKGGFCSHPGTAGMLLQDGINGLSVTNWHQDGGGSTPNGVFANTQTAGAMLNINFGTGNLIKQNTNGVFITGASGIVPVDGFGFVGSTITANTNGLVLPSSTPIGHFNISLNNIWENTSDYTFGISGGAAALVKQGVGTFGPNVTSSAPAYGLASIHQGSDGNVAGAVTLANGLNSNITTDLQGSIEAAGPTGAYSVGGFTNPYDGYDLLFFSANAQALTIVNEDTSSTATNRVYTYTGGGTTATPNVTLTPSSGQNVYAHFHYSISKGRWLLLDHS